MYFEQNRLASLADTLYEEGYRHFLIDEIHRYPHWSIDLKNMYDNYPDISIVATGSSILEVNKGQADLSRRAVTYYLPGLSFREYLELESKQTFPALALDTIVREHHEIAREFSEKFELEKAFRHYLQFGYYPFFREGTNVYGQKLQETLNIVLDVDIASYENLSYSTVRNMKKLLYIISQSVPFTPNISKISQLTDMPRNSILKILDLLSQGRIISLLRAETKGMSYLQKPEKIYLQNPNLAWVLSENKPDIGNLRETFFLSQTEVSHRVTSSKFSDFTVDNTYTFEIGGPSKTQEQIRGVPNAYIASDGIIGGSGRRIPLWLFGFLY